MGPTKLVPLKASTTAQSPLHCNNVFIMLSSLISRQTAPLLALSCELYKFRLELYVETRR